MSLRRPRQIRYRTLSSRWRLELRRGALPLSRFDICPTKRSALHSHGSEPATDLYATATGSSTPLVAKVVAEQSGSRVCRLCRCGRHDFAGFSSVSSLPRVSSMTDSMSNRSDTRRNFPPPIVDKSFPRSFQRFFHPFPPHLRRLNPLCRVARSRRESHRRSYNRIIQNEKAEK